MNIKLALPLLGCLIASTALAQNAPPAGGGQGRPAPAPPSNLKVLPKDISRQDLNMTMRGFTQALGVECEFCHEANPAPKAGDGNPKKNVARVMIQMTNDINSKYLSQISADHKQITCGNCHQGHEEPPTFTPAAGGPGGGAPRPPA